VFVAHADDDIFQCCVYIKLLRFRAISIGQLQTLDAVTTTNEVQAARISLPPKKNRSGEEEEANLSFANRNRSTCSRH
jgi:hypothetical protein